MILHNNLNDFILFLYVHMSEADSQYDPAEMNVIKSKMEGLFSAETDFEKKLYQTIRAYNSVDKEQLPALFKETFGHFEKEDVAATKLLSDLHEIMNADGKVDPEEGKALEVLKEIIEQIA